jgi:hypothetical protein
VEIGFADRQRLGGIKADVLAEIERPKQIAQFEAAQRDTATNRITTIVRPCPTKPTISRLLIRATS